MDMKVLLTATMLSVLFFGAMGAASIASAQYMGNVGEDDAHELSVRLGPQERPVQHSDRDHSYLDADDAIGTSVVMGAVFGGVAGAFFLRGRSGTYAAMGRGYPCVLLCDA